METSDPIPSKRAYPNSKLCDHTICDGFADSITDSSSSSVNASEITLSFRSDASVEGLLSPTTVEAPSALSGPLTSPESSPSASRKSQIRSGLALSVEDEQPSFSSLESPLMRSLVSPTTDRFATDHKRPALFDDHVAPSYVPGSLHLAPDTTIEKLVDRLGAIPLIRQLAGDLAHRDRELVLFRLKAEERERTLKKMLVEAEVSNSDIEKRLASCLNKQSISKGITERDGDEECYTDSIDDMMQQALDEDDAFSMVDSASLSNCDGDIAIQNTIVTPRVPPRGHENATMADTDSIRSSSSQKSSKLHGWKEYFWGPRPDPANAASTRDRTASISSITSKKGYNYQDQCTSPTRVTSPTVPRGRSTSRSSIFSTHSTRCEDPDGSMHIISDKRLPSSLAFHHNLQHEDHRQTVQFKATAMAAESTSGSSSATLVRRKASDKAASLALKLVVDARSLNGHTTPSTSSSPINTRAVKPKQISRSSVDHSSTQDLRSGGIRDDLHRLIARNTAMHSIAQRQRTGSVSSTHSTRAGAYVNGRLSTTAKDQAPGLMRAAPVTTPPDASFGPVEMDTIVPHAVQPPTLLQSWNEHYPADYLTDRFGFIYDKKERRESSKGLPMADSISEDALESKIPNTPGQSANLESIHKIAEEENTMTTDATNESFPSSSEGQVDSSTLIYRQPKSILERMTRPSASVVTPPQTKILQEVPLALRSRSGITTAGQSTIKVLLSQLSDMHDSLQRDRSIKWNEFLKKVRAERRRGDAEENGMPEVLMADGELIGVSTWGSSGKGGKQKLKEFRRLVLDGIPVSYRWKVWTECSGAGTLKVPGYYDELLQAGDDDPHVILQISMDINRTLTDNIFFRKGPGVHKLNQVLIAYSRRNPAVGYCQGMNMIAASLLLIMPTEEDAFWVLVSIIENILPKTYFEQSLLASRADQIVLKEFVREILPNLDTHLRKLGVELEALTFQWFLSIFTDCLAGEALFRVWDVLLCVDGSTFLFQTALALLRLNESSLLACDTAAAVYSYLNSSMTHQGISIDGLIQAGDVLKSQVKKEDVETRRESAIKQELELTAREGEASGYSSSIEHADSDERFLQTGQEGGCDSKPKNVDLSTTCPIEPERTQSDIQSEALTDCSNREYENSSPSPPMAPWL